MRGRTLVYTLGIGLLSVTAMLAESSSRTPLDATFEGPQSPYTEFVLERIRRWNPLELVFDHASPNPIQMKAIRTKDRPRYVGVSQVVLIDAPIKMVARVVDDVERYQELSPGFKEIRVLARDRNKTVSYWEKATPTFFIPNIKYEMTYVAGELRNGRKMSRCQLRDSQHVGAVDCLMVLTSVRGRGRQATLLTRYDFIDTAKGIFASAPVGQVWNNIFEDIYLSNAGFKFRAENPNWTASTIVKESWNLLHKFPVDPLRTED